MTEAITLYRKYRPQRFSELTGQHAIKTTLENEIAKGEVAHAYLFTGPRGIGKTTTARLLAKAVNCLLRTSGENEPCNRCAACTSIREGRAPDIVEVDAASNRGIDEIRELREHVRYAPVALAKKVYIIDEAHMLTTEAANALLKTLEEPPAHALFILATTEPWKLPETIISRCQRFDFRRAGIEDITDRLVGIARSEKVTVPREILEQIARQSQGSIRDAESTLGKLLSIGGKTITQEEASIVLPRSDAALLLEFLTILTKRDARAGFALVGRLIDEGVELERFAKDLVELLRRLLHVAVGKGNDNGDLLPYDAKTRKGLEEIASSLGEQGITRSLERFLEVSRAIPNADIPQLPLELAIVELTREHTDET